MYKPIKKTNTRTKKLYKKAFNALHRPMQEQITSVIPPFEVKYCENPHTSAKKVSDPICNSPTFK